MNKLLFTQVADQTIYLPLFVEQCFFHKKYSPTVPHPHRLRSVRCSQNPFILLWYSGLYVGAASLYEFILTHFRTYSGYKGTGMCQGLLECLRKDVKDLSSKF